MRKLTLLLLGLSISLGVFAQIPDVDAVYSKELDNWQRRMSLWKMRNFVPLVGLYPLKQGKNSFGSSKENDIWVESNYAPKNMGTITLENDKVTFTASSEAEAVYEGKAYTNMTYTFDADRNSEKLRNRFVIWYVQKVGDDYLLRVLDDQSPKVRNYEPQDYFAAEQEFIIPVKYKTYKKPKNIKLDNVIDTYQNHEVIGNVRFKYRGEKYELLVLTGDFIMFTDETNGESTFPYGRYVSLSQTESGQFYIDFNYAFSPPRAVSDFTTCDIPPEENHLPFAITAGEKYEGPQDLIRPIN